MRILFVCDVRSPISQNWLKYFSRPEFEVLVISTYPCSDSQFTSLPVVAYPIGLLRLLAPRLKSDVTSDVVGKMSIKSKVNGRLKDLMRKLHFRTAHITVPRQVNKLRKIAHEFKPDLVHAMRIPMEGILATQALADTFPVVCSVWGNDFTLFAEKYPQLRRLIHQSVSRCSGLHADCHRDIRCGVKSGLKAGIPTLVTPSSGGLHLERFTPPVKPVFGDASEEARQVTILNPRGIRGYVRNDVFFKCISKVLEIRPQVRVVCANMRDEPEANRLVSQFNLTGKVELLPFISHDNVHELYQTADITVSLSNHDGTPNSLIEAMACGCLPVCGNIESVREWIIDGENGILCDQNSIESATTAILKAIDDVNFRVKASIQNTQLVSNKAEYGSCMKQVIDFYETIIYKRPIGSSQ